MTDPFNPRRLFMATAPAEPESAFFLHGAELTAKIQWSDGAALAFVRPGDTVHAIVTVKAIEAEGFRDEQLHRLALMLHDSHTSSPPLAGESAKA